MDFAYAQGLIASLRSNVAIKDNITWGGYYIIAPENGCADSVDPNSFEEIWQYGSNLGETNSDPLWEQDGIAPQCAVTGITAVPTKGGRAFIPANYTNGQAIPKGFVPAHSIPNYGWIFTQPQGQPGYVTPK